MARVRRSTKAVLLGQPRGLRICWTASIVPNTTRCCTSTRRRRRTVLTTCAASRWGHGNQRGVGGGPWAWRRAGGPPWPSWGSKAVRYALHPSVRNRGTQVRSQPLDGLMQHAWRHRQGAGTRLAGQQQLPRGLEGRPPPVAGALQAFERFIGADRAIFDATPHGIQLVKLQLAHGHITKQGAGKGPQLL